jgi:hypothetical protein
MAVKRPLSLDPGAAVPKLGSGKMVGNIRNKQDRPVAPETTHGVVVSSAREVRRNWQLNPLKDLSTRASVSTS